MIALLEVSHLLKGISLTRIEPLRIRSIKFTVTESSISRSNSYFVLFESKLPRLLEDITTRCDFLRSKQS